MPLYEFRCTNSVASCPSYEVWRAINERGVDTQCPGCGAQGQRVYSPPMTLSSGLRLKQERREPELVRRSRDRQDPVRPRLRESTTRPWMVNRGC
jgi:putative FmdB family regulatory protein